MAIPLTVLPDDRQLQVAPGTTILKAAQAGGIDITATCGGRGRCTSCRVKFVRRQPQQVPVEFDVSLSASPPGVLELAPSLHPSDTHSKAG